MKRILLSLGMAAVLLLPVAAALPRSVSSDAPPSSGGAGGSASPFEGISVLSVGQKTGVPADPPPGQWSDFPADSDGAWSVGPNACFRVRMSTPAGTPMSTLAALVAPRASLLTIWRFDDSTKQFPSGYASDPSIPTDFSATKGTEEFYFFCVGSAARIGSPPPTALLQEAGAVVSLPLGTLGLVTSQVRTPTPQAATYHAPSIIAGWPQLSSLNQGESVTSLQYLLQQGGATLAVDGKFGAETGRAVTAFQKAQGLTADGIVGPNTWQALIVTVQQGSQGAAVQAVQSQLKSRGVAIAVNGNFDAQTDAAVRTYQQGHGLTVDGIVHPLTWQALLVGSA